MTVSARRFRLSEQREGIAVKPSIALTAARNPRRARLAWLGCRPLSWAALLVTLGLAAPAVVGVAASVNRHPGNAALHLGSVLAGDAPQHRLTLDVDAGDPEIHRVEVRYPPGFSFKGFHALGDPGTAVGAYGLDFVFDGTPDVEVPLRSLGAGSAFVDVFADGRFDSVLEPVLHQMGGSTFSLTLPFGGDATAATLEAARSVRVSLVLFGGLIANPRLGGWHVIEGDLITVDPDTDGSDDGRGDLPFTRHVELPVKIFGPGLVPFARLDVTRFDLVAGAGLRPNLVVGAGFSRPDDLSDLVVGAGFSRPEHPRPDDRFEMHGRLVLGPKSDGIDLGREIVTVTLDHFRQSIEGRSFVRAGSFYHYRGSRPGITQLDFGPDGRFHIRADGLHWIAQPREPLSPVHWRHGFDPRLRFALRLGNDLGETTVRDARAPRGF
jgi:hypothetical protein